MITPIPPGGGPHQRRPWSGIARLWLRNLAWALVAALLLSGPVWAIDPADPAAAVALSVSAADLEVGGHLFQAHCAGCHPGGGNIIRRGRHLRQAALQRADLISAEAIAQVAAGGIGGMSGYGDVLGAEGARQVGAWIWRQAQAGWPATPEAFPIS